MSTQTKTKEKTSLKVSGILLVLVALVGCGDPVDNSGGEPPEGESLTFRLLERSGIIDRDEGADFVTSTNSPACTGESAVSTSFCEDALDALTENERLVVVQLVNGGCLNTGLGIVGAYLDGAALHMHVLKADNTYGVEEDVACSADIQYDAHAVAVLGADAAETTDLKVGVFNPDLDDAPVQAD